MNPDLLFFSLLTPAELAEARRVFNGHLQAREALDANPHPCIFCRPDLLADKCNVNRDRLLRQLVGDMGAKFRYSRRTMTKVLCPDCFEKHNVEQLLLVQEQETAERQNRARREFQQEEDSRLQAEREQQRFEAEAAQAERAESFHARKAKFLGMTRFQPCVTDAGFGMYSGPTFDAFLYCVVSDPRSHHLFTRRSRVSARVASGTVVGWFNGELDDQIEELHVVSCRAAEPFSVNVELPHDCSVGGFRQRFPSWELLRSVDRNDAQLLESLPFVDQLHPINYSTKHFES